MTALLPLPVKLTATRLDAHGLPYRLGRDGQHVLVLEMVISRTEWKDPARTKLVSKAAVKVRQTPSSVNIADVPGLLILFGHLSIRTHLVSFIPVNGPHGRALC